MSQNKEKGKVILCFALNRGAEIDLDDDKKDLNAIKVKKCIINTCIYSF